MDEIRSAVRDIAATTTSRAGAQKKLRLWRRSVVAKRVADGCNPVEAEADADCAYDIGFAILAERLEAGAGNPDVKPWHREHMGIIITGVFVVIAALVGAGGAIRAARINSNAKTPPEVQSDEDPSEADSVGSNGEAAP